MIKKNQDSAGFITPMLLGFLVALTIIISAVIIVIDSNSLVVRNNLESQESFNIAEAGINYYLWHMSHNSGDYKDGQTTPATPDPVLGYGPYTHHYINSNLQDEGTFTLWIKPQGGGSTIVTIRSIGKTNRSNATRTVEARIGAPSFASYAVASDTALWFGNTETATGPVHSNQGIRMDGASSSDVTSSNTNYTPPISLGGDGANHPGVWCSPSVTTPVNCNSRSKIDWRYPVPTIDFNQVVGDLCNMKKTAFLSSSSTASLVAASNPCSQTPTTRTAAYLPQRSTTGAYTLTKGYLIQLNNNGTYDLYSVNAENDRLSPYTSALTLSSIANSITVPSSGVIFAEDNVWVRSNPTFSGRVTIAAGRLATNSVAEIVIADDLIYSTKSGADVLGLVSEGSITVAPYAPPATGSFDFEIDAAVIAQSGDVEFPVNYRSSTSMCTRGWKNSDQKFLFYGSVATRQTWTWTYVLGNSSCGNAVYVPSEGKYMSGIINNNTQYDYNLMFSPPPNFPITSTYNVLSWREVLTQP
jgi:hypothetical protein